MNFQASLFNLMGLSLFISLHSTVSDSNKPKETLQIIAFSLLISPGW